MYEVYLAHHGILGMKWGIRRYQNKDGTLTEAGKKRYRMDADGNIRKMSASERQEASLKAKQRELALAKARQARTEKAEHNKKKAEAIKSGDASKIAKYFNELSQAELKEAMDRINTKQSFQQMLNKEAQLVSDGKTKVDRLMDGVGKATDYAEKGIKAYNVIAKVSNAFNGEKYMPSIDGNWAGDRKRKLEKERKEEAEAKKKKAEENRKKSEEAKAKKEETKQREILRTKSAQEILDYAKDHPNVSAKDLGESIQRLQYEYALQNITKGGEEAERILDIYKKKKND